MQAADGGRALRARWPLRTFIVIAVAHFTLYLLLAGLAAGRAFDLDAPESSTPKPEIEMLLVRILGFPLISPWLEDWPFLPLVLGNSLLWAVAIVLVLRLMDRTRGPRREQA